jgi:hypothetical protein
MSGLWQCGNCEAIVAQCPVFFPSEPAHFQTIVRCPRCEVVLIAPFAAALLAPQADARRTREALTELVRLKTMKDEIRRIQQEGGEWHEQNRAVDMNAEYKKAQPLAWQAARKALAASEKEPK